MAKGVLFDRDSAELIAETVRGRWPRGHIPRTSDVSPSGWLPPICGVLMGDLEAAEGPLTGATLVAGKVLGADPFNRPTDTEPGDLAEGGRIENLINRSTSATGEVGTFFKATWINSEWLIDWLDCAPSDEGITAAIAGAGGGGATSPFGSGGFGGGGFGS